MKFDITMPVPEKVSLNKIYAGMHWTTRARLATLYHNCLLGIPVTVFTKPVVCTYTFTWKTRSLDASNQVFMVKMLEDGLVKIGCFPDDTNVYVTEIRTRSIKSKTVPYDIVRIQIEEDLST